MIFVEKRFATLIKLHIENKRINKCAGECFGAPKRPLPKNASESHIIRYYLYTL